MKDIMEILIAGGDMRQLFCAERLADKYGVSVIGFDPDLMTNVASMHTNTTTMRDSCTSPLLMLRHRK